MNIPKRPLALLAIQLAIVLSLWGKLQYDRAVRPRFWVQAAPVDPDLPIRGRYMALSPVLPIQNLVFPAPRKRPTYLEESKPWPDPKSTYRVRIKLQPGASQLTASALGGLDDSLPHGEELPDDTGTSEAWIEESQRGIPPDRRTVTLDESIPCFIPENAPGLQHLQARETLWMEVTLPSKGPLRVIRLAVKAADGSMRMMNP